jgi:hypothetical protein
VNTDDTATPFAAEVSVSVFVPLLTNVPLAPDDEVDAVKVTTALLTGFPPPSRTVTMNGANVPLIGALCVIPPVTWTPAGAPIVFVSVKLAGVVAPEANAVTA